MSPRRVALSVLPLLVAVVAVVLAAGPSAAATHQVTSDADDGPGSYRAAIVAAATDVDPVVIEFDPGLTVTLASDVDYSGSQPITLRGNGSTIEGNGNQILGAAGQDVTIEDLTLAGGDAGSGGAVATGGKVTAIGATFRDNTAAIGGGFASGDAEVIGSRFIGNTGGIGGGFSATGPLEVSGSHFAGNTANLGAGFSQSSFADAVVVTDSTFEENQALAGGGLQAIGDTTVSGSTFSGNSAPGGVGGGLAAHTTLAVVDSTFDGNTASAGGAIALAGSVTVSIPSPSPSSSPASVDGASVTNRGVEAEGSGAVPTSELDGTTIAGSDATVGGGVVAAAVLSVNAGAVTATGPAVVDAVNTTFTENSASQQGGAIAAPAGDVGLLHVTAAGGSSPEGAEVASLTLGSQASVLAPASGPACTVDAAGTDGDNYDTDGTCGFGTGARDVSDGADPGLDALGDAGGPTPTRPPAEGSPLIDSIPVAACSLDVDQRDLPRPVDGDGDGTNGCDVGAVEVTAPDVEPDVPDVGPVAATPTFTG